MKEFRALLIITAFAILIGCGTKKEPEPQTKSPEPAVQTEEDKVKASLTELIDRMMEGDKTVLYENEFGYYTQETSLSDYMKEHRVIDYNYDTLGGITYDSVEINADTAMVYAKVHYNSKAGGETVRAYRIQMFKYNGKWIKPYMSKISDELEYLKQKRIYDSSAAAEEAEQQGK